MEKKKLKSFIFSEEPLWYYEIPNNPCFIKGLIAIQVPVSVYFLSF